MLIKELDEKHDNDVNSLERNVTQNIENINNRVNNLLVQNQPTEGNSELIDIRTGAEGKVYSTAGEAVRAIGKGTGLVDKGVKSRSLKSVYADKITFNMLSMLEMVTTGQAVAQITDSEVLLTNSGNTVQFGVRFNNITPDLFDEKFQFTVDYESDLDHVNWYISAYKGDNKVSWASIGSNVSGNGSKLRTFDKSHLEYAVSFYNTRFGTSETLETIPSWSVYICVPFIGNVPNFNYDGYFKISNILVTSDRNLNKSESEIGEVKEDRLYLNGLKVFGTQDYDSNTELAQISDYNQYGEVLDYDPDLSLIPNSSKLLKDLYTNIHQPTGSQIEKTSNSVKFTREKSKVDSGGQSYALYGIPKTNFTTPKTNYLTIVTNFRITNGDGNCQFYILLQGTGGRIIRQVKCTNTDSDVYYTGRYIIKLEGITGFDKSDFEIRLGVVYRYNDSNRNPVQAPETFSATFYELEVLDGIHPEVTHIKRDSYTRSEIYNKQEIQTILQDYETKPEEPVKPDLSWFLPSEVYVTCNDVSSRVRDNRTYSAEIYLDHCLKSNPQDESLSFKNAAGLKLDSVAFVENSYYDGGNEVINNGKTVDTQTKQISIQSDKYKESTKTLKVISTKASVQTSKPRILCIGDSVTAKTGANNTYGNGDNCYWQYVKELFYMDKIDGSNDNMDCIMLGNIQRDTWNLSYNGESYQLQGNACGLGSRSLADYLHRPQVCKSTQEGWDNMGFGDGSGTDYKGTTEQVHKMVTENWKGYTGNNPEIPFYNKDKAETENISFDLGIWLERYRTMDDEGNRLTWGDERIGSLITSEDLLKSINCCKPTHVIMAHGTNDYGTLADYIQNQKWFAEYMTENYPDVFVGIFVPDVAGTYWIDRYPEFIVTSNSPIKSSSRLDKMQEICTTFNANPLYPKVYPMPAFFTAPTAYGLMLQPVPSPEVICDVAGNNAYKFNRQKCIGDYPSGHPGSMAHATWAYQIYSWVKYTMSL